MEPVAAAAASALVSPTINTPTTSSIIDSLPSSPPEISLETQLEFSRHGHTVLRSFLPESLIADLRSELVPYAAKHALSAWRQKVEVQLADSTDEYHRNNVRSIVDNLTTAEECQELLESFGIDPFDGDLPFLQHFNIWRSSSSDSDGGKNLTPTTIVRNLCLSPYLAHAASILLDESAIFTDEIDVYTMDKWIKGTKALFIPSGSRVSLVGDIDVSKTEVSFRFDEDLMFNVPFKPVCSLSGKVVLTRDVNSGLITSYREYWDQSVNDVLKSAKFGKKA